MSVERGAQSAAAASVIDMSGLGLLQVINSIPQHQRCRAHGKKVELVFDTGIVVYVPAQILGTMVFHLEPDYVEDEIERRPQK